MEFNAVESYQIGTRHKQKTSKTQTSSVEVWRNCQPAERPRVERFDVKHQT